MRTATAHSDLGGDAGTMLRQLRILEDSHRQLGGIRGRADALRVRLIRRALRKLLTPR
jgi:hypothetical protein